MRVKYCNFFTPHDNPATAVLKTCSEIVSLDVHKEELIGFYGNVCWKFEGKAVLYVYERSRPADKEEVNSHDIVVPDDVVLEMLDANTDIFTFFLS